MTADVRVVAPCGSRRDDSETRTVCRTALDGATEAGAETTLVDLREYDLPPLDPDACDAGDAPALRAVVGLLEVAEYAGVDEYPAVADGPYRPPAVD